MGKRAFSLEEAPCGPTTSVGGSTGFFTEWALRRVETRNRHLEDGLPIKRGLGFIFHSQPIKKEVMQT